MRTAVECGAVSFGIDIKLQIDTSENCYHNFEIFLKHRHLQTIRK